MNITRDQATIVAKELFGTEFHDGIDCKNEVGRVGQPCRICAEQIDTWNNRIDQVHKALQKVFP